MAEKKVVLACTVCGSRNYTVPVTKTDSERFAIQKYCKHCNKKTLHQETR